MDNKKGVWVCPHCHGLADWFDVDNVVCSKTPGCKFSGTEEDFEWMASYIQPTFYSKKDLAEYVQSLGGTLWEVGGSIRNELLGIPKNDEDFVITGVSINSLPFISKVGHSFPVFLVKINGVSCEVALARTERKTGNGHKGFSTQHSADVTIQQDLSRRDLTVNAIARNVLTEDVFDPFEGIKDVENKVLRHVTDAFAEDPLRVLRVARFASTLGFSVDEDTLAMMHDLRGELSSLPPERIFKELRKALNSDTPSLFFRVLKKAKVLDCLFPEIAALEVPDKHDGTALEHTFRVMDTGNDEITNFCLLVHDFGKGATPTEGHPSHHQHDKLGVDIVRAFCNRLKVPNKFREMGMLCAKEHMRVKLIPEMRAGKALKFLLSVEDNFNMLYNVSFIDSSAREGVVLDHQIALFSRIWTIAQTAFITKQMITGKSMKSIGYSEGKKLAEAMFQKRVSLFRDTLMYTRSE